MTVSQRWQVPTAILCGSLRHEAVLRGQAREDLLARLEAVEARELPRLGRHLPVRADHDDRGQAVALPRREVVGVVRRSDLHDAGAELAVHEDRRPR